MQILIMKMSISLRKLLFTFLLNSTLFLTLYIGIQNSSNKNKINFIINETIYLPVSFIVGASFISGSILGNILFLNIGDKR